MHSVQDFYGLAAVVRLVDVTIQLTMPNAANLSSLSICEGNWQCDGTTAGSAKPAWS